MDTQGRTKKAKDTRKPYVLCRHEDNWLVQMFSSATGAEEYGRDNGFFAAIGPFDTKFAAELVADYGRGNPHMQSVQDAEDLAKHYLQMADNAIENDDTVIYDVAADRGQIVDNVKHMSWFREAVAIDFFETA